MNVSIWLSSVIFTFRCKDAVFVRRWMSHNKWLLLFGSLHLLCYPYTKNTSFVSWWKSLHWWILLSISSQLFSDFGENPWCSHGGLSRIANEYVYLAFFSYFLIWTQRFGAPTKIEVIWQITGALWLPSTIFFTLLPWETLRPSAINTLVMNNSSCLASLILRCKHEGRDLVTVDKVIRELNNSEWLTLNMVSPERKSRKAFTVTEIIWQMDWYIWVSLVIVTSPRKTAEFVFTSKPQEKWICLVSTPQLFSHFDAKN
jgi:hypothetical protein